MQLTAGLLTYNSQAFVKRCLKTLVAQEGLTDWQIVVLDNASPDASYLSDLEKLFPQIKLVRGSENVGFAKGHNAILREFPADFHAVLNIDVVFSPDFLATLLEALKGNPEAGSATGKLLQWKVGQDPECTNVIDSAGIEKTFANAFYDLGQGETDRGQFDEPCVCFGGTGAATIYRRESLEEVAEQGNFFDEKMFMYKEDIDLAYRLQNAGHSCLYVPKAVAWHARTTGTSRKNRSKQERIYSAAHESPDSQKQRKNFSTATAFATAVRQSLRWLYLLLLEPRVFRGARKLLRNLSR